MDARSKPLRGIDFSDLIAPVRTSRLSEQVRAVATFGRSSPRGWRERYAVDPMMREEFGRVAETVRQMNTPLHRRSNRLNAMLTLNIGRIGMNTARTTRATQDRLIQNLRNCFRGRPHTFAGIWRREVHGDGWQGEHLHLLVHAPRGMRARFIAKLPCWTGDPLDVRHTSRRFDRPAWQAVSVRRTWHLCRIYSLGDALDYIAKAPLDQRGDPIPRSMRLAALCKGVREYGTFGLPRPTPET